jgi:flavin reductase (DIM6/NTAB) family NADH-FMN oxidoreductase RutF
MLPACAAYLRVKLESTVEAGDHLVTVCELVGTGYWEEGSRTIQERDAATEIAPMDETSVLYTGFLRQEGIL